MKSNSNIKAVCHNGIPNLKMEHWPGINPSIPEGKLEAGALYSEATWGHRVPLHTLTSAGREGSGREERSAAATALQV